MIFYKLFERIFVDKRVYKFCDNVIKTNLYEDTYPWKIWVSKTDSKFRPQMHYDSFHILLKSSFYSPHLSQYIHFLDLITNIQTEVYAKTNPSNKKLKMC